MRDPDTSELDYILTECFMTVGQGCPNEILPDATRWWVDHYRPRFYKALVEKHRKWNDDRANVLARARVLGGTAAELAGDEPVTKAIAQAASKQVDCPTRSARDRAVRGIWCQEG